MPSKQRTKSTLSANLPAPSKRSTAPRSSAPGSPSSVTSVWQVLFQNTCRSRSYCIVPTVQESVRPPETPSTLLGYIVNRRGTDPHRYFSPGGASTAKRTSSWVPRRRPLMEQHERSRRDSLCDWRHACGATILPELDITQARPRLAFSKYRYI